MNCAEFKELAAVYALGAIDPAERAAADAHLAEPRHEGCPEALREALAGMQALAESLPPIAGGERVWRGIEARIAERPPVRKWRERAAWAVAAAALILAALFIGRERRRHEAALAGLANDKQECLRDLQSLRDDGEAQRAAIALLMAPHSLVVTLSPPSGTPLARAVVDRATSRAMVLSGALAARADRDYQVWIIRGSAPPVPVGLLRAAAAGMLASLSIGEGTDAIALSLEPKGGSPNGRPTEVLAVGALPKS